MFIFLMSLIYIMELKCLDLRLLIYLAKKQQFFVHSAYVSSAYSTKQSRDFVKYGTH